MFSIRERETIYQMALQQQRAEQIVSRLVRQTSSSPSLDRATRELAAYTGVHDPRD